MGIEDEGVETAKGKSVILHFFFGITQRRGERERAPVFSLKENILSCLRVLRQSFYLTSIDAVFTSYL